MRVLSVDAQQPDRRAIAEAAAAIRAGKLVVFPTETVYGLGARAADPNAVKRIFEVKGRPPRHPLIVHVLGEAQAQSLASRWPPLAADLAKAFWPGPLTLVVPKGPSVPPEATGGGDTVALRAPSHPVARALIAEVGEPIVAPSANRYQSLSPTRAEHVLAAFGDQDLLILDGGPCPSGIESTVVDACGEEPRVLRPGALSLEALRAVVPSLAFVPMTAGPDSARTSPGMDARHYAPRTPLVLAKDRAAALDRARALVASGESIAVVLIGDPLLAREPDPGAPIHVLPGSPESAGAALYALLYELDEEKLARVVVQAPPAEPGWEAVADRLRRAAH
ncbi:MAG TPA: L-threonylcarbamoyladenylate synthase [Polyangiaceae bacterium]|nr:L-threonylcarbamoyladenylate synthase [Polyangiaceae bacterium]